MTGTITKRFRRDGKPAWGYSFFAGRTPAGKRIQITKSGLETRKEAADALLKAIQQNRLSPGNASRLSFAAFLNQWLEQHARHQCTPKTLERYGQLGQHATKYLGETDLQSLAPMAIQSMLISISHTMIFVRGWKQSSGDFGKGVGQEPLPEGACLLQGMPRVFRRRAARRF